MFRKADRDNLAAMKVLLVQHVHEKTVACGEAELFWCVEKLRIQALNIEAGQDALLQSQAALKADLDAQKQYLCDSFLAIRALLTALDRRLGEKHPYTQQMWNDIQAALNNKFEQFGRTQQVNGKRKRKAA